MATKYNQSLELKTVAGSSNTWHKSASKPDTKANKPNAAVGKPATRCVIKE
jgi:hypothetical protein